MWSGWASITEEELQETVQLVASVAAGVVLAAADRGRQAADHRHFYWRPPKDGTQEERRT